MAVLIRSERVERKIRELAARTGWGLTGVVERAVDLLLATLPSAEARRADLEATARVQAQIAARTAKKGDRTD